MSDTAEVEVDNPSGYLVLPKDVTAEIGTVKLFNKWSYEDVEVRDISLTCVYPVLFDPIIRINIRVGVLSMTACLRGRHLRCVALQGGFTQSEGHVSRKANRLFHDSDYIQIRSPVYISHSAGRYAVKRFRKANCPIIERLTNSLMMNGRNNGKKLMAVRIVAHSFEIVCKPTSLSLGTT